MLILNGITANQAIVQVVRFSGTVVTDVLRARRLRWKAAGCFLCS